MKNLFLKKTSSFQSIFLSVALICVLTLSNNTFAQITQPTAWTQAYDQTNLTCNTYSFSVSNSDANRILIVGISNTLAADGTFPDPTTVQYGGVNLTKATSNGGTTGRAHTYLYYLKDNAVMDGTPKLLNVTFGSGAPINISVWYGVFANVDQTPASYTTGNYITNTSDQTPIQLSTPMAIGADEQAIYISSLYIFGTTIPTFTFNANWTGLGNNFGDNGTRAWRIDLANRNIPAVSTTDNAITSNLSFNARKGVSAMSLPLCPEVLTISDPSTAVGVGSMCASATNIPIHAFNISSTGANTLTNFQFTTTGTYVGADLVNFKIWWNSVDDFSTATLLSTNNTPGGPGVQTFPAFTLNIPDATTYNFWITVDNSASPVNGHTLTVSGSNSTDMTTTAARAGGPTAASGTKTVEIGSPTVSITATPPSPIIAGTTVTFTPTPTIGGSSPTYEWFLNGSSQGTGPDYVTNTLNDGDQVYCIMTSNSPCASPLTATSNTITMTVNPAPLNGDITWALTANGNAVETGGYATGVNLVTNGITVATGGPFNATWGAQYENFGGGYCSPTNNANYQFSASPNSCYDLDITQVLFTHRLSAANRCYQLRYSIDGGPETQIDEILITVANISQNYDSGPLSISVPDGSTIRFRLYGAGSSATDFGCRDFIVNYDATVIPSTPLVSIAAAPATTICDGTNVTITPTPTGGGTAPTYEWFLNGSSQGTSATYVSSTFNDGDEIYCIMTSNSPCASPATATSNTITITVLPPLGVIGSITGSASVISSSVQVYSVAAVTGATNYVWTIPGGAWTLDAGQGTISISSTAGLDGEDGDITVYAENMCSNTLTSILSVTVADVLPHNNCNGCHIWHEAPAGALTAVSGNANLCMSCHNPTGTASSKPIDVTMKADPGVSGTSHSWDIPSVNAAVQSNITTDPSMLLRLPGDSVICSTCHNQHGSGYAPNFLRIDNTGDALCKNCHTARDKGTYAMDNVNNRGTHPVGISIPSNDNYLATPTSPIIAPANKVECSSCHKLHYAAENNGNILRTVNDNNLCTSCHNYRAHKGMGCKDCHETHNNSPTNIYMIQETINGYNVVFTAESGAGSFADGDLTFNGVCEVCHTAPDPIHHTNTNDGGVHEDGQNCTTCHPHEAQFFPQTNCLLCHNTTQGPRRAIVGASGDFVRESHHANGVDESDCVTCHYMGNHMNGTVQLLDPDLKYDLIYDYNPASLSDVEDFCLNCHDADGKNGDMTPFTDGVTVPLVDSSLWANSSHKSSTYTCLDCHDNGHGSNKRRLLAPYNYSGGGTGTDVTNEEEGFCFGCHGSGGAALEKVHLAFSTYTNTATRKFKHDVDATYRVHTTGETTGAAFANGASRHVECVDCHNPHAAKAGTATAPAMLPTLIGATGVEPVYGPTNTDPGAPTGFTWLPAVTQEYQVCYKCHSSFTTLPTYLPDGWNTNYVADGLRKLTTSNNGQIPDSRDMAQEYNPNNESFHPVMAAGKNLNINANTFQTGWSYTSRVYCIDCHNNPLASTAGHGSGPHGSSLLHMLDKGSTATIVNYPTYHTSSNTNISCTKCHQATSYVSNDTGSRFDFHNYHYNKNSNCYDCHDTHGSETFHLMNFSRNVAGCITNVNPDSQGAFRHANGTSTNSCVCTCHGTGHSTSSKTYNPMYN